MHPVLAVKDLRKVYQMGEVQQRHNERRLVPEELHW